MPRVSRAQVSLNRESITDAAAGLIRERGIDGVSVADVMAGAGLTHGGFYGHFDSKQALIAAACQHAFERAAERWRTRVRLAPDRGGARARLIDTYVSAAARDAPSTSCPATALAGDVARAAAGTAVRGAYTAGVGALIDILAKLQPHADPRAARRTAIADFSLMVGSVILARATQGGLLSDEILSAARSELHSEAA